METGGKQGSRLTGRMFAKMMDLLAEALSETNLGFKLSNDFMIAVLLWVDDVLSCVDGLENQMEILNIINEFALKHKIKWGQDKCRVMKVGRHDDKQHEWKVGEMVIQDTNKYRYLGGVITNDGKNLENISSRKLKLQATSITINTIASSDVLCRMETSILLELHEKQNISSLLFNSES